MTVLPINILLVEDNPADAKLTRVAFKNIKICNDLHVVKDGVEALAYLRQEEPYTQASRPDLILLDLNLPRKDGRQVLAEIKADEKLRAIPVVILTTSTEERDVWETYTNYANSYITKPVDLDGFISVVQGIENFWFTIVKLPRGQDNQVT